jgi:type II secretory pathway component PulK
LYGQTEKLDPGTMAYRFSIVADDPLDDEDFMRYGITDESSRLNLNVADRRQLMTLFSQVITDQEIVIDELVDSLLDWRDVDDEPREFGAEAEWYEGLVEPYRPKNGAFRSVEELLMVRGFSAPILYGEDWDRNGLLTLNEDDGTESFPLDDQDGVLNRGLYPYLTVFSRDFNTANDNKPRLLPGKVNQEGRDRLAELFESDSLASYIAGFTPPSSNNNESGGENGEGDGQSDQESRAPDGVEDESAGEPGDGEGDEDQGDGNQGRGNQGRGNQGDGNQGRGNRRSKWSLLDMIVGEDSPLVLSDLLKLADVVTTSSEQEFPGLININTAPPIVLRCIQGMTEEMVSAIVETRGSIAGPDKSTTAWLVTQGAVTDEEYRLIEHQITARGFQFTAESLGYGDHTGTFARLQVVFEMRGPLTQTIYYRDLTTLGRGYDVRKDASGRVIEDAVTERRALRNQARSEIDGN